MKVGVNGAVRDISDLKVGANGAVRPVSEAYIGVNGAVKKVWPLYKVVEVGSKYDSIGTNDVVDEFFEITDAEWTFHSHSSGWFNYYTISGGPVYAYYVISSKNSTPYSIQNGKFVLKSPGIVTIPEGSSFDVNNKYAYAVLTLTNTKSIHAWIGFNTTNANSFNYLYYVSLRVGNSSPITHDLSITLAFNENEYKSYVATKIDNMGVDRICEGKAYAIQKG